MGQQGQQQQPPQQNPQLSPATIANGRRLILKNQLEQRVDTLKSLLPAHVPAQKFIDIIINSCLRNPGLLECTIPSLVSCAFNAAQLGLTPDSFTGEAHLIPFKNTSKGGVMEAQFIPGYRGLVQLAIRSGQVKRFQARAVYKEDEFEYSLGTEEYIRHKPTGKSKEVTHFYAILEFTNGGLMFDVMTKAEVDQVRDASPNYKSALHFKNTEKTIWAKHYDEMGKKTVIRRLSKYAPISPEFQQAVSLEEQVEVIGDGQTIDVDFEELSPEEQEMYMTTLLEKDKLKKEENSKRTSTGNAAKDRAENITRQTEEMLGGGKPKE